MTVLDRPAAAFSPLTVLATLIGTVLASVLFAVGWSASKTVLAVLWCVTAVRLGWDDARQRGGG